MKEWLTVTDIAEYLAISRPTAYKIIAASDFPQPKLGKRWASVEVLDWLEKNYVGDVTVVGGMLVR